jgi:hypothetical protein
MQRRPPSGMASPALTARFSTTCSSSPGGIFTHVGGRGQVQLDVHGLADEPLQDAEHGRQAVADIDHVVFGTAQRQELLYEDVAEIGGPLDLQQLGADRPRAFELERGRGPAR